MDFVEKYCVWLSCLIVLFLSGCSYFKVQNNTSYFKHTVVEGETLWSISRQYGIDVDRICEINPSLDPNKVSLGTTVLLPQEVYLLSKKWTSSASYVFPVDSSVSYRKVGQSFVVTQLSVPVYSVKNGKVILSQFIPGWGQTVLIDCGHQEVIQYSGLKSTYVTRGDVVFQGQSLGNSGKVPLLNSSSFHAYIQIYKGGKKVDTLTFLGWE